MSSLTPQEAATLLRKLLCQKDMTTITYCKGLPTPADELNPIGFTELEMFLTSLSDIFYQATVETVNH
ncbi:MAG: hypothetical protein RLP02_05285, partial [Coleofasciculus sp. C2-GNP5-27]